MAATPVLWHIPISHYSEKARWALDWKGIEFRTRAPAPGAHIAIALWLTRGEQMTFPVLELEGRAIGDSTAIIAALEEYRPDPPLYPDDPGERRRALELEEFFDEELGPHVRLLAFHELRGDPEAMRQFTATVLPPRLASSERALELGRHVSSAFSELRYRVASDAAADRARAKTLAALDRLDRELEAGAGEFLVGDRFSVADLAAASLFMPLTQPTEGPNSIEGPESLDRLRALLLDRPGYRWALDTYARFRRPGVATSGPSPARP